MMSSCRYWAIFLGAIISSASCYFWGVGFNDSWVLAWFSPLPVLLFGLYTRKAWHGLAVSFFAYSLGSLNVFYYFNHLPIFIFMPIFVYSSFVFAFLFSMIIFITCYTVKKTQSGWSVFFFPCLWVCYEYTTSYFSSSGTLVSMAYSQLKFLPFLQIASIFGIWGISFVLT